MLKKKVKIDNFHDLANSDSEMQAEIFHAMTQLEFKKLYFMKVYNACEPYFEGDERLLEELGKIWNNKTVRMPERQYIWGVMMDFIETAKEENRQLTKNEILKKLEESFEGRSPEKRLQNMVEELRREERQKNRARLYEEHEEQKASAAGQESSDDFEDDSSCSESVVFSLEMARFKLRYVNEIRHLCKPCFVDDEKLLLDEIRRDQVVEYKDWQDIRDEMAKFIETAKQNDSQLTKDKILEKLKESFEQRNSESRLLKMKEEQRQQANQDETIPSAATNLAAIRDRESRKRNREEFSPEEEVGTDAKNERPSPTSS